MADTQQGVRHQSARDAAGTVDTYDGDLRALFEAVATVPAGSTFNEAFMLWLQSVTGSSADNINDLAALFASQQTDTYNWSSVGELGAALPTLFDWNPETAATLPATATFTRAFIAQVLTTTDGTTNWYQEAKSGEVRLDGLRRVENFIPADDLDSFSELSGATISGNELTLPGLAGGEGANYLNTTDTSSAVRGFRVKMRTSPGDGTATIRLRIIGGADVTEDISVTETAKIFFISGSSFSGGANLRIQNNSTSPDAVTLVVEETQYTFHQLGNELPDEFVQATVEHLNIGVNGVKCFNTTNGNSVDGSFEVTEATGTTITGGGYLPEGAATKRLLDSNDMTQASWTAAGAATPTDIGETSIGGNTTQVAGLGALGVDDILQSAAGFTASGPVAPSVLLQRVSATGTLRIVNAAGGAVNGEWQVDLSLIGAGWVRLEPGAATGPAAVPGFSEVTPWVADGTGNAGMTYHAAAGGPLTVNLAFNNCEDTPHATSPMVTTSGLVTRVADVMTILNIAAQPYSLFADLTYPVSMPPSVGTGLGVYQMSNSGSRIQVFDDGSTTRQMLTASGDGNVSVSEASVPTPFREKIAARIDTNNMAIVATGLTTDVDTVATIQIVGDIILGIRVSGSGLGFRGRIHVSKVFNAALTNAELEAEVG